MPAHFTTSPAVQASLALIAEPEELARLGEQIRGGPSLVLGTSRNNRTTTDRH